MSFAKAPRELEPREEERCEAGAGLGYPSRLSLNTFFPATLPSSFRYDRPVVSADRDRLSVCRGGEVFVVAGFGKWLGKLGKPMSEERSPC
jgi:hypothetical protein